MATTNEKPRSSLAQVARGARGARAVRAVRAVRVGRAVRAVRVGRVDGQASGAARSHRSGLRVLFHGLLSHRGTRFARPAGGCSGGLIMLASAWKNEASPVGRGGVIAKVGGMREAVGLLGFGRAWVWAAAGEAGVGSCVACRVSVCLLSCVGRGAWGGVAVAQTQPRKMITRGRGRVICPYLKFVFSSRQPALG